MTRTKTSRGGYQYFHCGKKVHQVAACHDLEEEQQGRIYTNNGTENDNEDEEDNITGVSFFLAS